MESDNSDSGNRERGIPNYISIDETTIGKLLGRIKQASGVECYAEALRMFGKKLFGHFGSSGDKKDLAAAIFLQDVATKFIHDSCPGKPFLLNDLGISYQHRFQASKNTADFDKSVDYFSQADALLPSNVSLKPVVANNLGGLYIARFQLLGESPDFEKALKLLSLAISLANDNNPDKPGFLINLGLLYKERFCHSGDLEDMSQAVASLNQVVLLSGDDFRYRPLALGYLAETYHAQFEELSSPSALEEAINYSKQAVCLTPEGDIEMAWRICSQAVLYFARYKYLGKPADINRAIGLQVQVVALVPDGHERKPKAHSDLGALYSSRFKYSRELADIDKAIEHHSQALSLAHDKCEYKAEIIRSFGGTYMERFHGLGEFEDVDKAIYCLRQALALTFSQHADRRLMLFDLGWAYFLRFERLNGLSDLENSIEYQTQALSIVPQSHIYRPLVLQGLGVIYQSRFHRVGDVKDVHKSLTCLTEAAELTPDGHSRKPQILNNLGLAYRLQFEVTTKLVDLNKAIDYLEKAAQHTADEHSLKPGILANLASAHELRFDHIDNSSDLSEAFDYRTKAVSLTPDNDPTKVTMLNKLGALFVRLEQLEYLPENVAISKSSQYFRQAAQCLTGSPRERFKAARSWALVSFFDESPDSPLLAHKKTMELLPQLAWLGVPIDERYKLVADMGDVTMQAAVCAILVDDYALALEWLEEGRSVIWNQILQLRTSFDKLSAVDPALAKRLEEVGRELDNSGSQTPVRLFSPVNPPDPEHAIQRHHLLASEWDCLLEKARAISGFESFMRARKAKELLGAAQNGPIVIINVHMIRCDALVIRPNSTDIAHIHLERFSIEKANQAYKQMVSWLGHRGSRAGGFKRHNPEHDHDSSFKSMLATLWSDIAKPILDFLGYTRKLPVDELPHITWCTTGPLSFLPLHAAGCYNGVQPNIFDLVISSYTPTLGALLARNMPAASPKAGILAVGQEYTKDLNSLPNTVRELAAIKGYAEGLRYYQLDGNSATVDAVLNAMEEYSWVHLAWHATQDRKTPTQSAFHLCNGKLTLADITKKSLKNKGLAFLSACQTATGDEELPEEAIHLAAGMLMAGYPSVIATMWSVGDEDAAEVARGVYAELLKDGEMNCEGAAKALHKAVGEMRDRVGESSFSQWVPFIHIGL